MKDQTKSSLCLTIDYRIAWQTQPVVGVNQPLIETVTFMIYFVPKVFALAPTLAPTTILQLQNKRKALINSFALNIILKILHDVAIL